MLYYSPSFMNFILEIHLIVKRWRYISYILFFNFQVASFYYC